METVYEGSGSNKRQVPVRPPLQRTILAIPGAAIDLQLYVRPGRISLPRRGTQQQPHGATCFRR